MSEDYILDWAKELQALAQTGLCYSKDVYDIERFERIREISAEMISKKSGIDLEVVKSLFCNETGFQTPKLDCRAVVFKDDKILLVKENTGLWSLPGGWVDINQTIRSNTEKEVYEEACVRVKASKVIALHDRNLHNEPIYAYNICKVFVLCDIVDIEEFVENSETTERDFFASDSLPMLALDKTSRDQIELCFASLRSDFGGIEFD